MDSLSLKFKIPDDFSKRSGSVDLPDGKYKGVIKDIKIKQQIPSGRNVVEFTVEVKRDDGRKAIVKLSPDNDIKSKWLQSVLTNLGHKLAAGKNIDIEKDIGAKVLVEISNVQKGDRNYCNIVRMTKIESSSTTDGNKTGSRTKDESKPISKTRVNHRDTDDEDDDLDLDDEDSDEDEDEDEDDEEDE